MSHGAPPDGLRQPVTALAAQAQESERAHALESGFDVHIQKPVAPHDLALAVAELSAREGSRTDIAKAPTADPSTFVYSVLCPLASVSPLPFPSAFLGEVRT